MWELDREEGWGLKNWCFWTVVLEKTLESPLDCKEIKPVHHKGNQSWIFIGRTDAKAESPVLGPPNVNSQLIGKDLDAGKDWGQEEKWVTEDEIVGSHHWLSGHEFEQTQGDSEGQESLACRSSWGCKESDGHDLATEPNLKRLIWYANTILWRPTSFKISSIKIHIRLNWTQQQSENWSWERTLIYNLTWPWNNWHITSSIYIIFVYSIVTCYHCCFQN